MRLKRLPRDDLAVAKPVGPRALALVSDFIRFDPSELDTPQPDHGVPCCYEALRENAWLHDLPYAVEKSVPRPEHPLDAAVGWAILATPR
jgi:hypothetical protein